jgi:tetratricopeptide (TPR) repeat protein
LLHDSDYAELENLVKTENYTEAAALCLDNIGTRSERQFWLTQYAYVNFLNKEQADAQYSIAPDTLESLTKDYPDDENAHFWFGYISLIFLGRNELARQELATVLQLTPNHAYANLVLAELVSPEDRIKHLQRALKSQPTNFRVLQRLAELFTETGQLPQARQMLQAMLDNAPYVETHYGIMTDYVNGVLTCATSAEEWRLEAKERVKSLSST